MGSSSSRRRNNFGYQPSYGGFQSSFNGCGVQPAYGGCGVQPAYGGCGVQSSFGGFGVQPSFGGCGVQPSYGGCGFSSLTSYGGYAPPPQNFYPNQFF